MYNKYKDNDLITEEMSKYNESIKLKDVYRTMILAISLTHSGKVYLWINGTNQSDPVTRYEIYKKLYNEGLIVSNQFETLTVEEMRWVMNTVIDDEEILWLNNYTRTVKKGATGPYSYIRYTFGYNYYKPEYYSEENRAKWETKYGLEPYGVTYGNTSLPKLWIVFEEGSVCGGLSKTGSCVWGAYKGLPNTCVCQPGHCAYIYYAQDSNGNGVWGLGNDVSGWAQSGRTEHLNVRMMNDWGTTGTSGWTAPYVLLAQGAQNEYEKYEEAQVQMMLSRVYNGDYKKQEEIYEKALEIENINYDAWLGMIDVYLKKESEINGITYTRNKYEKEVCKLAVRISEDLTYYPRPMYDLMSKLEGKLTKAEYILEFNNARIKALTKAKNVNSSQSIQVTAVKQVATALLGGTSNTVATFSFDGENAGAIVLGDKYQGTDAQWDYNLGNGWSESTGEKKVYLTAEELKSITAENDIKVHIIGTDYSDDNIYKIDITNSQGLPKTLYANDLENRLIAVTDKMVWRYNENDEWTLFIDKEPDLTGDKAIHVKINATGTTLESETKTFTFTEENLPENKEYVPISHLSVVDFSSENVRSNRNEYEYARNAIDGNINTWWHTSRTATNDERYIVIKLDEPMYISSLEFVPIPNYVYGVIKDAEIYTSMDGENFEVAKTITNMPYSTEPYELEFNEAVYTQYIKIKATHSYDYLNSSNKSADFFLTMAMINVFKDVTEDITFKEVYIVNDEEIELTENYLTNQDVTVKISANKNIEIINETGVTKVENGYTHTFTENGSFTFYFRNIDGNIGGHTVNVNCIDKIPPVATVKYDITVMTINGKTGNPVTATIECEDEEIIVTNNDGKTSYTFMEDGEFTFEYKDLAGNVGTTTAKASVTWIDARLPDVEIKYTLVDELDKEDSVTGRKNVMATLVIKEPTEDEAEKIGTDIVITRKRFGTDIKDRNLLNEKELSDLTQNYTFTENGVCLFEYTGLDANGNQIVNDQGEVVKGEAIAKVDWIIREAPVGKIEYDITSYTTDPVTATLITEVPVEIVSVEDCNNPENIIAVSDSYKFEKNGKVRFTFKDVLGNVGNVEAEVTWINVGKEEIVKGIEEGESLENIIERLGLNADEVKLLKDGIETDRISTGCQLVVNGITRYILVVSGDINGDGFVDIRDMSILNKHLLGISTISGTLEKYAADTKSDDGLDIVDLSIINRKIINKLNK